VKFTKPRVGSQVVLAARDRLHRVVAVGKRALRGLDPRGSIQAARRRTSQTVAAMSSADSASSQPASIHWNGQNRLGGW
jgi:hypothetical protein